MKIPTQMQPIYDEIAEIIEQYCEKYLDEEYCQLCLRLLEVLCRKRPSPLLKGRRNTWAAGIVYAIASNNFIFDKSMPIHRTAEELSRPFGLAPSTVGNKAIEIRKLVDISPMDAQWTLRQLIEDNPLVWMLSIDGYLVDARNLPLELQQEAARRGLIPYVPSPKPKEESHKEDTEPVESPASEASQVPPEQDSPAQPLPPDDFSDIYDRFRLI